MSTWRTRAGALAGVAALLVGGGTAGKTTPASAAGASASAAATPSYSITPRIEAPLITAAVTARYGRAQAMAAFRAAVGYVRQDSYAITRMRPKAEFRLADFAPIGEHMTAGMAREWTTMVRAALAGDDRQADAVAVLAWHDLRDADLALPATGPYVVDEIVTDATVTGADGGLSVGFVYRANLRMTRIGTGDRMLLPVTKQMSYVVVRSTRAGRPTWLIDSYAGDFRTV
jgi:hypothetical protein